MDEDGLETGGYTNNDTSNIVFELAKLVEKVNNDVTKNFLHLIV